MSIAEKVKQALDYILANYDQGSAKFLAALVLLQKILGWMAVFSATGTAEPHDFQAEAERDGLEYSAFAPLTEV